MAFEMAVYGAVSGLLYQLLPRFHGRLYAVLIPSMILGRVMWGIIRFLLAGLTSSSFPMEAFIAGAVTKSLPGIILQLVLIPPLVAVMDQAGLNLNQKN